VILRACSTVIGNVFVRFLFAKKLPVDFGFSRSAESFLLESFLFKKRSYIKTAPSNDGAAFM